jgi:tripartite-type tricarboxylate transporter receptor subunit TctC
MERALGHAVVVDNKAGAGGALGAAWVARAPADGHTLRVSTPNALVVLPQMTKTSFKLDNFQPVGLAATTALVIVVKSTDTRFKDIAALLDFIRANPGKSSMGHAGLGTTNHVALMQMEDAARLKLNIIPYKGGAPALVDLIGGQVDAVLDQLSSSAPHIQSGALRALAVLSRERDPALPNVSTLREAGLSDFEASTAACLLAPAGTPAAVIEALNAALRKALAEDAVRTRLAGVGSVAHPSSAQEFGQLLNQEDARAQVLAKAGKLKAD